MAPRKRGYDEMESSDPPKESSLLEKIRNMWEFAATMQFIFMFGKAVRIDEDFDIEDFETECLKPGSSEKLEEIGLTLLKWISSHRGLNFEIWDEYTRRQYVAKSPDSNPYGDDEEPKKFREFDIFTRIRVLHQLTIWTFWNPDRIRERMPDHQREVEQLDWRIEELGYDRDDRQYYLLDDNRLYRRTEPPLPPAPKPKPKSNSLKAQAARRRASKRRRIVDSETPEATANEDDASSQVDNDESEEQMNGPVSTAGAKSDTFGGFKWECVAINLTQYQDLCESFRKSRDPNEKLLRQRLLETVIPIIEAAEEKQRRKIERRERELMAMEKLATAKRSSRIADKHDRERLERDAAESERKRAADLAEAHRLQELQEKMDQDRQSRMMTREQRIKDREFKRLLKEEELAKAAEDAKRLEAGETRGSERHLKEKMERAKKDLEELQAEDDWTFDCSGCGVHGKNLDDGSHSVACEKCSVWQHSKCLGITKAAAEDENFHFVCRDCKRRAEEANKPKITIKMRNPASSSPPDKKHGPAFAGIEIPKKRPVGRPPGQKPMTIGQPQASQTTSPSNKNSGAAKGYLYYTAGPSHPSFPPQYQPYSNGHPQQRPTSSSPPLAESPSQMPNGYGPRPSSSSGQPYPASPYFQAPTGNVYSRPPGPYTQYPPYFNGVPHQYQGYPLAQQTSPSAQPRHSPGPIVNGATTSNAARLPSPVLNRPTISPTQGNYNVGQIAGLPQKSPPLGYHPALLTPSQQRQVLNPTQSSPAASNAQGGPTPMQNRQSPNHMSGMSPTKHSPIPPPSSVPQKLSMSPPPPHPTPSGRVVSSTQLFPPAENLAPSPTQLSKDPVPTPSKQMTAEQMGNEELRRVSEEIKENVQIPMAEASVGGRH